MRECTAIFSTPPHTHTQTFLSQRNYISLSGCFLIHSLRPSQFIFFVMLAIRNDSAMGNFVYVIFYISKHNRYVKCKTQGGGRG